MHASVPEPARPLLPADALGRLVIVAAMAYHLLAVLAPAWVVTFEQQQARDFASYYYAVQVGSDGGDPYDRAALGAAARADGTRNGVHPFLYAPPFLLGMSWARGFGLADAFHLWFWLDELFAMAAMLVLWRWWRELGGPTTAVVIAVAFALMTAVPNNHAMGQANFPGLLLALLGLWQTERGRPFAGGALMGAACMLKMSPALFVVWWLVRREWVAVAASVASAALLSVLSLPFASPAVQLGFFTHVLPSFSSGDYNGLGIPVGLFGNHSVPNLWNQVWPGKGLLSPNARFASSATALLALGALGAAFYRPTTDRFARAAQASAYGVLLLLIPVYTYEHHLVFALPAAVISVLAIGQGRLDARWTPFVAAAVVVLLFDLQVFKAQAEALRPAAYWVAGALQELKSLGLVALLVTSAVAGRTREATA